MRALVIEDDLKVQNFIAGGFRQQGYSVDCAADGYEGSALLGTENYSVAIIDVMLPHMDGIQLLKLARAQGVQTPVLMLSAKGSVQERIAGLEGGADDYLVKPFVFAELLARVKALTRRTSPQSDKKIYSLADLTLDLSAHEVSRSGNLIPLQPREFALLKLLLENAGHVVSKAMILEHVWDYHFDPQTSVIDVLVCRLRGKIDRDYEPKLIQTIRGGGYAIKAS